MSHKRTLEMLTIKDNFLFGAVMAIEENCRRFLEISLGFPIEHVEVSKEHSMVYHPEYKSIRMDVFAKDENHTRYNVEMQIASQPALGKRARYYHSQIDMELLRSGRAYSELPNVYVIFICDFDPFGRKKYCYTFENCCLEQNALVLNDGCCTMFLSTHGENKNEVPESLVTFLTFVKAGLDESTMDFGDAYIKSLQKSIQEIKTSREMEARFMVFDLFLDDERREAKAEGKIEVSKQYILELLGEFGAIPDKLSQQILSLQDENTLNKLFKLAAKSHSLDDFSTSAKDILDLQESVKE